MRHQRDRHESILAPQIVSTGKSMTEGRFVAQCRLDRQEFLDTVKYSLDQGARPMCKGPLHRRLRPPGALRLDCRRAGADHAPGCAGIGAHRRSGAASKRLRADFWMNAPPSQYWSSRTDDQRQRLVRGPAERSNSWNRCRGSGSPSRCWQQARPPRDGFRYAFESSADFICVGMYDFKSSKTAISPSTSSTRSSSGSARWT